MIAWRPWLPTAAAGLVALASLMLGVRTTASDAVLRPLPKPVRVRSADVAQLGAELAMPLFAPSHSLAPLGPVEPAAPLPQLSGIVLGSGRAVALLKDAKGDTRMLHAGDIVDGWTIVAIAARQIIVAHAGTQQTIALEFGASTQPKVNASDQAVPASNGIAPPSFDGLAAAGKLGLPGTNIPLGSPLQPGQ